VVRDAGVADFLADVDQSLRQVERPSAFRDLFESLPDPVRRNQKGNGNGLTFLAMSQGPRGSISRFAGLGATAILAQAIRKTSPTQIAKSGNLGPDALTLSAQIGHGWISH